MTSAAHPDLPLGRAAFCAVRSASGVHAVRAPVRMGARSLGSTLVLLVVLIGCGADGGERRADSTVDPDAPAESEFCDALAEMYDAQQQWTVEYLNSLTYDEALANQAEQAAVARPVREAMPDQFVQDWDLLEHVGAELQDRINAIRPATGTTESLLAEARRESFDSIGEYLFRDGLTVDGQLWTYEQFVELGSTSAAETRAYCEMPPIG